MIERVLEYLFYKIQYLTRIMSTSVYRRWHTPLIMSIILFLYCLDLMLGYMLITDELPFANSTMVYINSCLIIFGGVYIYYNYKHRYIKIMQKNTLKEKSNIGVFVFVFLPFVLLIILSHFIDENRTV